MGKQKKLPAKIPKGRKTKTWHDEVVSFLDNSLELKIKEGNVRSIEYLETCIFALGTCRQLGIVLRRPEEYKS